jgi:hypothetical protein
MATSAMMTVRIDARLLDALKAKSRRNGRTVSASIVELIRNEVGPRGRRPAKPRRTMGMFADFEVPELDQLVRLRRGLSRRLIASSGRKRKPR